MGTAQHHRKNDRKGLAQMHIGPLAAIPRKRSQIRFLSRGEIDGGLGFLGEEFTIVGSKLVGPANSVVFRLPDGRFVIPEAWSAGGGGVGRMSPAQAAALGGTPITIRNYYGPTTPTTKDQYGNVTRGVTPAYIFSTDPSGSAAAGQATVSYKPGTGTGFKSDLMTLAPLAAAGLVFALVPAAVGAGAAAAGGGAAAAGEAAAAGAIMPGAAAAAGGATGGIATAAGTTAALTGGAAAAGTGILGTGISLSTATSIAGAAKTALSLSQQHKSAAAGLMQTAQQQYDAGNVAAAQALQEQANANTFQAQSLQAQANDLLAPLQTMTVGGIPLLYILGGGLLLVLLLKKRG
jgi:hypothetical protein